jgi:hypothetical protein
MRSNETAMTNNKTAPIDLTVLNIEADYMAFTAAGSGDRIYIQVREILAFEVNSETNRVNVVMKNGSVVQVNDTIEDIAKVAETSRW